MEQLAGRFVTEECNKCGVTNYGSFDSKACFVDTIHSMQEKSQVSTYNFLQLFFHTVRSTISNFPVSKRKFEGEVQRSLKHPSKQTQLPKHLIALVRCLVAGCPFSSYHMITNQVNLTGWPLLISQDRDLVGARPNWLTIDHKEQA